MKTKISMKDICQSWKHIYYCSYCDLQDIMRYEEPTYYNSGVYGWNCDIYTYYSRNIAITTGYRNMRGKRIPSELIKKYADIANSIMEQSKNGRTYEEIKEALEKNKENFLDELANI